MSEISVNITTTFDAKKHADFMENYLESLSSLERLLRLLLDIIKDEFKMVGYLKLNAAQALLLLNMTENEVTVG